MGPCLVQQLFRQKVGVELDQDLMDEVLFPMLRSRKELSRELLLDINLTHNCNDSPCLPGVFGFGFDPAAPHADLTRGNISPFTTTREDVFIDGRRRRSSMWDKGKITSSFRRECIHVYEWGAIDILNEFRKLKHTLTEDEAVHALRGRWGKKIIYFPHHFLPT